MDLSTLQVNARSFTPRNPAGTRVAAVLSAGAHPGKAQIADMMTGLGRATGYDSLANARRAAYMLTRGETRGAAGIFEQDGRFYVRAMGETTHHGNALLQIHMEGLDTKFVAIQDPRMHMLVDGRTKLFAKNA
jgi:hypothetical protein